MKRPPRSAFLSPVVVCRECNRKFDLTDDNDRQEWHYGHDCEGD